ASWSASATAPTVGSTTRCRPCAHETPSPGAPSRTSSIDGLTGGAGSTGTGDGRGGTARWATVDAVATSRRTATRPRGGRSPLEESDQVVDRRRDALGAAARRRVREEVAGSLVGPGRHGDLLAAAQ